MNRKRSVLTSTMIVLMAATAAVTLAPTAVAHTCSAEDPGTACGPCSDDIYAHDHTYSDNRPYCSSEGCEMDDVWCVLAKILDP